MGVDRGVPGCPCERFAFLVGNVTFFLEEAFCKSEINEVDFVLFLPKTHQEIVGLNVSVQKHSGVQVLNPLHHLISKQEHCLQREFALLFLE